MYRLDVTRPEGVLSLELSNLDLAKKMATRYNKRGYDVDVKEIKSVFTIKKVASE